MSEDARETPDEKSSISNKVVSIEDRGFLYLDFF